MPQTEEEHLENQNLDYEDHEKAQTDAEVSIKLSVNCFMRTIGSLIYYRLLMNYLRSPSRTQSNHGDVLSP